METDNRMSAKIETVKWGIIGAGDVAEFKCGPPLYQVAHSELVAVMRRDEAKAKDFAQRHGVQRYYTSAEELLADPEVNAVYIATPPHVHLPLAKQAAEAGKHILLEKPMALSVAECEQITAACKENNVQLIIAYYRRYFPMVRMMKKLLDSGAIGRPVRARALHTGYYKPPVDGERSWLTDPAVSGGGFMMDAGIHRFDLFAHFFGKAIDVSAFSDTVHFDFEVDDSSTVIIRFENGVHATAEFNWNVGVALDEFEISGTKGRLYTRHLGKSELVLESDAGREYFKLPPPAFVHNNLVEHFVHALRSGEPNSLPGEEGMKASAICLAAYESSRERKTISMM